MEKLSARPLAVRSLIVFGVLLLAATVRFYGLGALGFNSDEAVYAGQAASIVGDPELTPFFPIFRAHPLLFHFLVGLVFQTGVSDLAARALAVLIGIATVYLTYLLGRLLYGERAGLLAALFLALMPYHVVVTRQVLLDGPMTFFATLTAYLLGKFAITQRSGWLYATGAALGLTFLAKETGIILIVAVYAFLALVASIKVRIRDLALTTLIFILVIAPYPLTLILAGGGGAATTQQYLVWQLLRRPNHVWSFYPSVVPIAMGMLVLIAAVAGLWLLRRERSWREVLMLAWILVPIIFFQSWPVKGFHYLLLTAPAIAVLAGRALGRWPPSDEQQSNRRLSLSRLRWLIVGVIAVSLLVPTWLRINPSPSGSFLAGSGGVPGGREAGEWMKANTPQGSTLMTIGPSMANILQFYGQRQAFGLSVSPNPLHRNPAYKPIRNPDFEIRTGEIQYVIWDAYSAGRSDFFSDKLMTYAERYHGRAVHTESMQVQTPSGETVERPVIIVYEVRP